jgi:antagonist of KipI
VSLPAGGARVRVMSGPDNASVGRAGFERLQAARYRVSPASDRMGYRLQGESVSVTGSAEPISSAVPLGSIQIPPDGQPIVLMADHQTTGGYPRIATVITADIAVVGQLLPGDWVEFEVCGHDDALTALIGVERSLLHDAEGPGR